MSAIVSSCGLYRYRLEREISLFGPTVAMIMVNPSTADAFADDPTVRRIIGFGKRLGWSRVIVGNVFAYRAANSGDLSLVDDPVGPENAIHLSAIMHEAEIIVVAWGTLAKLPNALRKEWRIFLALAESEGLELLCFGTAMDGHPRHPLMLSYDEPLIQWKQP